MTISFSYQDKKYDISRHRVRCEKYPSLLDIVTIEDPIIYNVVIDQVRGISQFVELCLQNSSCS